MVGSPRGGDGWPNCWPQPQDGAALAETLTATASVQDLVQQAVATQSTPSERSVRSLLVGRLAEEYNLEHLLWRDGPASGNRPTHRWGSITSRPLSIAIWNLCGATHPQPTTTCPTGWPPTHGITVDFAAVSGSPQSDLTESILRDFRVAGLPSGDPFQITFGQVHGLSLTDLGSVQRYRQELGRLGSNGARQVMLTEVGSSELSRVGEETRQVQGVWR